MDFARLSSQVPTRISPCAKATDAWVAVRPSASTTAIVHTREPLTTFITIPSCGPSEEKTDDTLPDSSRLDHRLLRKNALSTLSTPNRVAHVLRNSIAG